MIYAVSLNPSLDKTVSLPLFRPDAPNRVTVERMDVGGKGVNVARVARELGSQVLLTGLDFDQEPVRLAMKKEQVPCRLFRASGSLRVNMKLREMETGRTLEINEQGPKVDEALLGRVLDDLLGSVQPGDWVSLSGSLPSGAASDTYRRFCEALQSRGCLVAADCDGEALREALQARPALIKPNIQEFSALCSFDPDDRVSLLSACRKLLGIGIGHICLSMGGEGAWLVSPHGAWACPAAQVQALGTQGAGDSMLAGLMTAFVQGMDDPDALRYGSAAAAASVSRPGTLLCRKTDVDALVNTLTVTAL